MEDADLEKAAELAVLDATKNSGQRCTAVKRILCVEAVADKFAEQVLKRAKKLKCGDPMDPSVDVGTVIHEDAAKEFERRVEAAVRDGARLLHGNNREGALYPPTVVDHVPHTLVVQETQFGPALIARNSKLKFPILPTDTHYCRRCTLRKFPIFCVALYLIQRFIRWRAKWKILLLRFRAPLVTRELTT